MRTHRVDCATDDAPQWIPGPVVKPVPEVVEALLGEKLGHSIVEVPGDGAGGIRST